MAAELIKVEVSRRILHIGSAAYPLQNIARVESQELKWVRWPAIKSFLKAFVIWQYYALIIDTAGSARAALVNPDRMLISDLVARITKAIENPDDLASGFPPLTINNYNHIGDNVNVSGAGSTGKADPQAALREMIGLVMALRGQVAAYST